jgi:N-acetylglutamate synthase-like GNAT family acetyltransferase
MPGRSWRRTTRSVGLVTVYRDPDDSSCAQLVSLWVSPDQRRRGVATALTEAYLIVRARAMSKRSLFGSPSTTSEPGMCTNAGASFIPASASRCRRILICELEMLRAME